MSVSPKILQLDLGIEIFSTRYCLRISSCLATIVSRALQLQDGRIRCPVDRNLAFFLTSHIDFWTMWRWLYIQSVSAKKSRGHRTSQIAKSRQSCKNGHLPYNCSFYYSARALMHDVASICVRSKDTQTQLARTSLTRVWRQLHAGLPTLGICYSWSFEWC